MSNSIAFFKMPAIAAYQLAVKQGDAALEKMAARKDVKAEVDYFRNNIQSVKSVEDLFKDRRMMKFILDATDLGKETDKMGLLKKVLTQKADRFRFADEQAGRQAFQVGSQLAPAW